MVVNLPSPWNEFLNLALRSLDAVARCLVGRVVDFFEPLDVAEISKDTCSGGLGSVGDQGIDEPLTLVWIEIVAKEDWLVRYWFRRGKHSVTSIAFDNMGKRYRCINFSGPKLLKSIFVLPDE